jgi:hypothetical protein
MGQRKAARVEVKLKVRIWGLDAKGKPFNTETETLDVSWSGARLADVFFFERPGETIGIEVGGQKARFLVVWVGEGERRGQIGLRSLDTKQCIWNKLLPRSLYADDYESAEVKAAKQPAPRMMVAQPSGGMLNYLEYRKDRRLHKRLPVTAAIKIQANGQDAQWGTCRDLSVRGCYAELAVPLPVDCRVDVTFRVNGKQLSASGIVRNTKGRGMGIEFLQISKHDQQVLLDAGGNAKSEHRLW